MTVKETQFFIIGAQRSGTTFLYDRLDAHPHVCMARPVRPEPKVFLNESADNLSREWYRKTYYGHCELAVSAYGEKSTSYIESPRAASRIQSVFPEARILVLVRNPIDRAISNYNFSLDNGLEELAFDEAIANEAERVRMDSKGVSVSPFAYAGRSQYENYLPAWIECFGRESLLVLPTEKIVAHPGNMSEIWTFLGVTGDETRDGASSALPLNESQRRVERDHLSAATLEMLTRNAMETAKWLDEKLGVDAGKWWGLR